MRATGLKLWVLLFFVVHFMLLSFRVACNVPLPGCVWLSTSKQARNIAMVLWYAAMVFALASESKKGNWCWRWQTVDGSTATQPVGLPCQRSGRRRVIVVIVFVHVMRNDTICRDDMKKGTGFARCSATEWDVRGRIRNGARRTGVELHVNLDTFNTHIYFIPGYVQARVSVQCMYITRWAMRGAVDFVRLEIS